MSAIDGIFMNIAAAEGSKSFEEVRIEDYLKAYQTTGRPPLPCPQEPADEVQRKALNLPPLFQPHHPQATLVGPSVGRKEPIVNPNELPPGQEFRLLVISGERYHGISCMKEYENFSHEELRYYAYGQGNINSPVPITMDPYVQKQFAVAPQEDKLQSTCSEPGYDKHSPEEFRIAFLLYRRELTSAELIQIQNPSAAAVPPLPPAPIVAAIPTPISQLPQPVFAAATPSVPKFTFGLR